MRNPGSRIACTTFGLVITIAFGFSTYSMAREIEVRALGRAADLRLAWPSQVSPSERILVVGVPTMGDVIGQDGFVIAVGQSLTKDDFEKLRFDPSRAWPVGNAGRFEYQLRDPTGNQENEKVDLYIGWPEPQNPLPKVAVSCAKGISERKPRPEELARCFYEHALRSFETQEDANVRSVRRERDYYIILHGLLERGGISAVLPQLDRYKLEKENESIQAARLRCYGMVAAWYYANGSMQSSVDLWHKAEGILCGLDFTFHYWNEKHELENWGFRALVFSEWAYFSAEAGDWARSDGYRRNSISYLEKMFAQYHGFNNNQNHPVASLNNIMHVLLKKQKYDEFRKVLTTYFNNDNPGLMDHLVTYNHPINGDLLGDAFKVYVRSAANSENPETLLELVDQVSFAKEESRIGLKIDVLQTVAVAAAAQGKGYEGWLRQIISLHPDSGDSYTHLRALAEIGIVLAKAGKRVDAEALVRKIQASSRGFRVCGPASIAGAIVEHCVRNQRLKDAKDYANSLPESYLGECFGTPMIVEELLSQNQDVAAYWFLFNANVNKSKTLAVMARVYLDRKDYRHAEGAMISAISESSQKQGNDLSLTDIEILAKCLVSGIKGNQ